MNDTKYFINDLFFSGYLEEDDYKKFDCVRNILVDEVHDLDSDKLSNILGILDDLYILFRTQDFSHIEDKVKLLREDNFQLIKERMIDNVLNK